MANESVICYHYNTFAELYKIIYTNRCGKSLSIEKTKINDKYSGSCYVFTESKQFMVDECNLKNIKHVMMPDENGTISVKDNDPKVGPKFGIMDLSEISDLYLFYISFDLKDKITSGQVTELTFAYRHNMGLITIGKSGPFDTIALFMDSNGKVLINDLNILILDYCSLFKSTAKN